MYTLQYIPVQWLALLYLVITKSEVLQYPCMPTLSSLCNRFKDESLYAFKILVDLFLMRSWFCGSESSYVLFWPRCLQDSCSDVTPLLPVLNPVCLLLTCRLCWYCLEVNLKLQALQCEKDAGWGLCWPQNLSFHILSLLQCYYTSLHTIQTSSYLFYMYT